MQVQVVLPLFFHAMNLPQKGPMAASLPEVSAFSEIRDAPRRLVSTFVEFQMSLLQNNLRADCQSLRGSLQIFLPIPTAMPIHACYVARV